MRAYETALLSGAHADATPLSGHALGALMDGFLMVVGMGLGLALMGGLWVTPMIVAAGRKRARPAAAPAAAPADG